MKELICIVCPKGCHLAVDEENGFHTTGHGCNRGPAYARKELTAPTRVLTSTVRCIGGIHRRLPVKTDRDIPREKLREIMKRLDTIDAVAPVQAGQVIIEDILGTGANIVATRNM